MPQTTVVFYREDDGSVPSLDWLDRLNENIQNKFIVRINRLAECGHELRPPEVRYLRDGVYELRVRRMHMNYRLLYFFHGQQAVLSHGIMKEDKIPNKEIDLAVGRLHKFERNPQKHIHFEYEG